jgi:mRNA-degrading endonuclease RelE of RelBE toxin-antitoxin system
LPANDHWRVELTARAQKDLDNLKERSPRDYGPLISDLKSIKENPFQKPPKVKKIKGQNGSFWRLRTGDFRTLYRIQSHGVISILTIVPRKELERVLKNS